MQKYSSEQNISRSTRNVFLFFYELVSSSFSSPITYGPPDTETCYRSEYYTWKLNTRVVLISIFWGGDKKVYDYK